MRKLVGRPSPALLISMLALFVALGSVALAGKKDKAPKNSVVSSSIKNGKVKTKDISNKKGVKSKDIVDGEVTGADVDESSLGQVPSSDKLDGLDADSLIRVAGASANSFINGSGVDDVLTAPITAPSSGFLHLVGSAGAHNSMNSAGESCNLRVDGDLIVAAMRVVDLEPASGITDAICETNAVVAVEAGAHTVEYKLSNGPNTSGQRGALNVLFVPFDGVGN